VILLQTVALQGLLVTLTTTHSSYFRSNHWHFKSQNRIRGIRDLIIYIGLLVTGYGLMWVLKDHAVHGNDLQQTRWRTRKGACRR